MIDIEAERAAVVAEARSWLRTPYHHMGRVKGAGVDCATLLAEIYARAGMIAPVTIPFYPPDWHLHREAERYLGFVLEHAHEIGLSAVRHCEDDARCAADEAIQRHHSGSSIASPLALLGSRNDVQIPAPADIALWRFGRCYSHGAIVIDWPLVIHAYAGRGCVLEDASRARWLTQLGERGSTRPRPMKFFRLKRWIAPMHAADSSEVTARAVAPVDGSSPSTPQGSLAESERAGRPLGPRLHGERD
jgi:cell wall-associated NlpC family hydrolase